MHVNTRNGIFGAGGYGGGLFDGAMAIGGLGKAPPRKAQHGLGLFTAATVNSTVKMLQAKLNDSLEVFGCAQLLTEDGLIGTYAGKSKTCGAIGWLLDANAATGIALTDGLIAILTGSQQDNIVDSCAEFTPVRPTCSYPQPVAPVPAPTPEPEPLPQPTTQLDANVIWMLEASINDVLVHQGMNTVREDAVLDGTVCGALDWMLLNHMAGNFVLDPAFIEFLSANSKALKLACDMTKPWTPPTYASGGPVTPPAPVDDYVECYFVPGIEAPQVSVLQRQLNTALDAAGYEPIAVTGKYDAATCGAIFELGGNFTITPSSECPAGWEVPLECPEAIRPTPKRRKMSTAAMLGIGAVVAAVAGAGLYAAKKAKAA